MAAPETTPVLSVSELTSVLRGVVEECFPNVWVAGEISNCVKAGSGHIYFTLKDDDAQLKAVIWKSSAQRMTFDLRDGLDVIAQGGLEVYPPRGQYQLTVTRVIPQGIGAQELALRQLQEKLSAEGLFDAARKRPLPNFPRRVALVTSPSGAAVRDMIQVLTRRWPLTDILVVPVAVQGEGAAAKIAAGVIAAGRLREVDVIILGRGGGSSEDLNEFNAEIVARAIAQSPIPVISAVGHEIDVTIADLVADRRALTPSEAAELAVPFVDDVRAELGNLRGRFATSLRQQSERGRLLLDQIRRQRWFAHPFESIHDRSTMVDELEARLQRAARQILRNTQERVQALAAQIDALSPLAVLGRGYSLTKRVADGELVKSVAGITVGDQLSTLLADGELISTVTRIERDDD